MNNFQTIEVSSAYESKTNPRGKDFEDDSFKDLVASIKEKGILIPVIARPKKDGTKKFEIIAGNRRFRASQLAGLKEIPAQIMDGISDNEAREIQIIENLQRADVHPIEEGASYRQLVEKSHYEISSIAAKVGKSESYIRQRLFLTNLIKKSAVAYRSGKITDGHAVLIAKLSAGDQEAALKEITSYRFLISIKELKEWIEENIYSPISRQPWLGDKEMEKVVGPCVECKPVSASLFGPVKAGACNDLKCWKRKMDAYVNYRAKKDHMTKVSDEYSNPEKGILSKSDYEVIDKKSKRCDSIHPAIIAQGAGIGKTIKEICSNKKCEVHHGSRSSYEQTPEEKEARKKELKMEKEKNEKLEKDIVAGLERITLPIQDKLIDVLIEMIVKGNGTTIIRPICKRHGWQAQKVKAEYGSYFDWDSLVCEKVKTLTPVEKIRLVVEFLIEKNWGENKDKLIKKL